MVMLIFAFCWMFLRWLRSSAWHYALLAGLLGGFAIFVKFSAAFFVIGAALGLVLSRFALKDLLKNAQVWGMAILGVIPSLAYLYYGVVVRGGGSEDGLNFAPSGTGNVKLRFGKSFITCNRRTDTSTVT